MAILKGRTRTGALENATISTHIEFIRVIRIEGHRTETDMQEYIARDAIIAIIIINYRTAFSKLFGHKITSLFGLYELPQIISQHINDTGIIGVNHHAVIDKTIAIIEVVAVVGGHVGQSHSPVGTLVFRNIDTSMNTVSANGSSIDDIGIRGSDGDIQQTSSFGKQGVAFHSVASA